MKLLRLLLHMSWVPIGLVSARYRMWAPMILAFSAYLILIRRGSDWSHEAWIRFVRRHVSLLLIFSCSVILLDIAIRVNAFSGIYAAFFICSITGGATLLYALRRDD